VSADSTSGWYTYNSDGTAATFTFTMNPSDAGAKVLNATGAGSPSLQSPFICGGVDDIVFFVDEGTSAPSGDSHPTLAMGTYDPSSGGYDIQALVDEAEDFQVAYGVDGADGSTADGAPTRPAWTSAEPTRTSGSATSPASRTPCWAPRPRRFPGPDRWR